MRRWTGGALLTRRKGHGGKGGGRLRVCPDAAKLSSHETMFLCMRAQGCAAGHSR